MITASIVTYKSDSEELRNVIKCLLQSSVELIYIVDNSPTDILRNVILETPKKIEYIFGHGNIGFGGGHNVALTKSIMNNNVNYHLVLNSDIYFDPNVIELLLEKISNNPDIGMMMPKILNFDGTIQYLPKLLPSPFGLLWRKIKKPKRAYQKFINKYELREVPKDFIYNAPLLSGCFTLLNLDAVKKIGMYDQTFFMYFEDWDLSRRIHRDYKTIYFPLVSVYHGYNSGANKNIKLFKIFINSMFTYFNKWGWFFDFERKKINNDTLSQFK